MQIQVGTMGGSMWIHVWIVDSYVSRYAAPYGIHMYPVVHHEQIHMDPDRHFGSREAQNYPDLFAQGRQPAGCQSISHVLQAGMPLFTPDLPLVIMAACWHAISH